MNIFKDNPTFILLLGLCPALAVTTTATHALGMGLLTLATLMGSNGIMNRIHPTIPQPVYLLTKVTIVSTLVTILQLGVKMFLPSLDNALGIYLPLIVVNCIVMDTLPSTQIVALEKGLGFSAALLLMGTLREVLGAGTLFGVTVFPDYYPMLVMISPPGALLLMGFILAAINWMRIKKREQP